MPNRFLTRRTLLAGAATITGGGLILGLSGRHQPSGLPDVPPGSMQPNAYLQVRPDGLIVLQVDKVEMGQGVFTGFATLVAEELGVRPDQIQCRQAPVHPSFQTPSQITAESKSMRTRWDTLRLTGAQAREMLRAAAAERWAAAPESIEVVGNGTLMNLETGERLAYAELARTAAELRVPDHPPLKPTDQFRWIGRHSGRNDAAAKSLGQAGFGLDLRLPGMLTAVVLRPPRFGDKLLDFDGSQALAIAGVKAVVRITSGVAVVADSLWIATRGRDRLIASWSDGPLAGLSADQVRASHAEVLDRNDGVEARAEGDTEGALSAGGSVRTAEYATPYLAHMTMEPMNATAVVGSHRCEIWAPVQAPDFARELACDITGLPREAITVHTTYLGGGFGRRALVDYVGEAVEIAAQLGDVPVQVTWTREDDLQNDYYRGATTHRLSGVVDDQGDLRAWEHRLAAPVISGNFMGVWIASMLPQWVPESANGRLTDLALWVQRKFFGPFQAWEGAATVPYAVPNIRVTVSEIPSFLRIGIWRSVGHSYNAFAVECFIDELAEAAAQDPADFRANLLADKPRHLAVLDELRARSAWGRPAPGRYQGMALHECFESVIGQVAEVSVSAAGAITVHKVFCVVDCGLAINPDIVSAQMESGIVFGLSAALYGELSFADGKVADSNFHDHPILRLKDMPEIETHIVQSGDRPTGVGEAATPAIAPAVANAIHAATGQRLRRLPLRLNRADG